MFKVSWLFDFLLGPRFNMMPSPSSPGPNITESNTSNIPEYAQPYVEQMLGAAQGEIFTKDASGNTIIKPYKAFNQDPNAYFAGFSPMQQQSQQEAANMQVASETGQASGLAGAAGMGALNTQYNPYGAYAEQFGQQQADQYMSPYMQNVVNIQQSAAQRQADIARTGRNAQAARSGAFGGSRQAIADAEASRALADQQGAIQAQGLQSAFSQAQQQFNADQAARMQAQQANIGQQQFGADLRMKGLQTGLQAAGQLGQLGQNVYGQRMGINQLRNQYGAQQQALEQAKINQQIQDYATAQQYPMMQLANMSALTRGLPMQSSTTQIYQAAPSMASQLAGLGTAAYGLSQLGGSSGGTGSVAGKAKGGSVKAKKRPAGLAELALMKMQ